MYYSPQCSPFIHRNLTIQVQISTQLSSVGSKRPQVKTSLLPLVKISTSLPHGNLGNQYFYVSISIVTYVFVCVQCTVLLRKNLTENAFRTRPERVWNAFLNAFEMRSNLSSIWHLRSTFIGTRSKTTLERVPVSLVMKSAIVGYYRVFPRVNYRIFSHFVSLCLHCESMGKLSEYATKRIISLLSNGATQTKIRELLNEEGMKTSRSAMSLFLTRYSAISDAPRRSQNNYVI